MVAAARRRRESREGLPGKAEALGGLRGVALVGVPQASLFAEGPPDLGLPREAGHAEPQVAVLRRLRGRSHAPSCRRRRRRRPRRRGHGNRGLAPRKAGGRGVRVNTPTPPLQPPPQAPPPRADAATGRRPPPPPPPRRTAAAAGGRPPRGGAPNADADAGESATADDAADAGATAPRRGRHGRAANALRE